MDKVNKLKVALLDKYPLLVYKVIRYKLKITDDPEEPPVGPDGFFTEIEKMLANQIKTDENAAEWKTIIIDLIDTINDLKEKLAPGLPVVISKRQGSIFYDRWMLFSNKVKSFMTVKLGFEDDHV